MLFLRVYDDDNNIIIITIIIIILFCNNNFSGEYWAVIGPKLSEPPGDPDYRGNTVFCFTTCTNLNACSNHSGKVDLKVYIDVRFIAKGELTCLKNADIIGTSVNNSESIEKIT
jgi:hypothetical protein